jgi:hypothetical protein
VICGDASRPERGSGSGSSSDAALSGIALGGLLSSTMLSKAASDRPPMSSSRLMGASSMASSMASSSTTISLSWAEGMSTKAAARAMSASGSMGLWA